MLLALWIGTPVGLMVYRNIYCCFLAVCRFIRQNRDCWIDNAPELVSACRVLGYRHHLSTENRHQSNGVAERKIRRILEGTRAVLHDSGLSRRYWHLVMRCHCALHNFVDVWKLDKTLYELRFNGTCNGQLIPVGSKVYCMPTAKH